VLENLNLAVTRKHRSRSLSCHETGRTVSDEKEKGAGKRKKKKEKGPKKNAAEKKTKNRAYASLRSVP
jgi:hypothetical protein